MNLIPRISRVLVAATMMAGSPGAAYAASALAPALGAKGGSAIPLATAKAPSLSSYTNLPVFFEKNHGQTAAQVKYFTRTAGYTLYLTGTEAVMVLPREKAAKSKAGAVVRMKLNGANAKAAISGQEILPGHTSYMLGEDRSKWQTGAEHYAKVKLSSVYPGIDMIYYASKGQIEHDFIVAPGANPGRILVGFSGAKSLRLDARGNLLLNVEGGEVSYQAPTLYQMIGAKRTHVNGRFVLAGKNQVRFEIGDYIKSLALVIDPALGYSSFLGGTVDDKANALIVDAAKNVYLTGYTNSTLFPGAAGNFQPAYTGGNDVFVTKISAAGALVWSTYLGGAGDDIGKSIGVDGAGNVYVSGSTTGNMPAKVQTGGGGGTDAFVAALNPTGTALVYATQQFGGGGEETANGIAVDAAGNAYVVGTTNSAAPDFVVVGAAQPALGGSSDAFLMKLNAAGAQVYSSFLGGTGIDFGNAVAVKAGEAYITGQTSANFPVFPVAPPANAAFKLTVTGANDAFIAKMDTTGANWLYVTYVGGSGIDEGTGIAVDGNSDVYITGYTFSADFPGSSFVTVGQTTLVGAPDAFVFKLRMGNGGLINDGVYATYLGGSGDDRAAAIAVDSTFNAYVTGTTFSGDFPVVGPITGGGTLVGAPEAFVTQIGPTGGTVGFSTYLGGTVQTRGQGIGLDSTGNIYATGSTNSSAATFPLLNPFQAANAGLFDAYITMIGVPAAPPPPCTFNSSPANGFAAGGSTVSLVGTGFSNVSSVKFDGISSTFTVNSSSTGITAFSPRHPLVGAVTLGVVPLVVTTNLGSCSGNFIYVASPVGGACGADSFFPSPAVGVLGTFSYCMDRAGEVEIKVYNAIGDLAIKVEDSKPAGGALSTINTSRLASGVYLYLLEKKYADGQTVRSGVKKFVVKH